MRHWARKGISVPGRPHLPGCLSPVLPHYPGGDCHPQLDVLALTAKGPRKIRGPLSCLAALFLDLHVGAGLNGGVGPFPGSDGSSLPVIGVGKKFHGQDLGPTSAEAGSSGGEGEEPLVQKKAVFTAHLHEITSGEFVLIELGCGLPGPDLVIGLHHQPGPLQEKLRFVGFLQQGFQDLPG